MKRKAEGIALLSLYNDDDEEEEEEDEQEEEYKAAEQAASDVLESPSVAAAALAASSIVDYAHDEAAASPRRENREGVSQDKPGDVQANSVAIANDTVGNATAVLEPRREERITDGEISENPDERLLAEFLPPPPTTKCSDELQAKFARFLLLKDAGRSFNEELRNSKGYRNPDFLQRAVIHQGVDQIGSCFRKEIFDPLGYDPEDFYDALALEQKRETERRDQERKQNQRVEFVRATAIAAAAKMMQQKGAVVNAAAAVASLNETVPKPEGRTNKKSKWDKVEPDTRMISGLPISAQNALAAHAALLSANAAGAAYTLAQQQQQQQKLEQKRKEEEKPKAERSKSDRKAERS